MELILFIAAIMAGWYGGNWFPLPDLESRWKMFFLRAFVIFILLQLGAVFHDFRYVFWALLLGYIWKGFRYGSGFKKAREQAAAEKVEQEPREFPRPPIGKGKKGKKHK
jgi:hypothetical protein